MYSLMNELELVSDVLVIKMRICLQDIYQDYLLVQLDIKSDAANKKNKKKLILCYQQRA